MNGWLHVRMDDRRHAFRMDRLGDCRTHWRRHHARVNDQFLRGGPILGRYRNRFRGLRFGREGARSDDDRRLSGIDVREQTTVLRSNFRMLTL